MIGAPLLAALTLAALRDYRALAVASAVTVGAYALDAILGSPLSALSLLGPNPALGVRFYGIGNELEALLSVRHRRRHRRRPGGLRAAPLAGALGGRLPRHRPRLRRDLRLRQVRRRRRRRDRLPDGRRGRGAGDHRRPAALDLPGDPGAADRRRPAGARRPRHRRQLPLHPLGARRRRPPLARRHRPAAARADRPQLRPPDPAGGAAGGRDRRPRRHLAARPPWRAGSATSRPCALP